MTGPGPNIAFHFDPEIALSTPSAAFLDAYLAHGRWDSLAAVVRARDRAKPLIELCRTHPSSRTKRRRLQVIEEAEFPARFAGADRPADVLHFPSLPDARFAWLRHTTGVPFALCGVVSALASPSANTALCDLVSAPFGPFDAIVCPSRAALEAVRAITGCYAEYFRERFGGAPALLPRLELIPPGVQTDRVQPATADERTRARIGLGLAEDEVVVLCLGWPTQHGKPFPAFHAAQHAARGGGKVHLLFADKGAQPASGPEFHAAARYFAPAARASLASNPVRAWEAADVFVSLPDGIEEVHGSDVLEAMARGLPVVASDWGVLRDLVAHGETGFLVPARMVRGATATATSRMLFGQIGLDSFLTECGQAAAIDPLAAGETLARLVADAGLRKQMGAAARARTVERFGWERAIRAYEALWSEQTLELAKHPGGAPRPGPPRYAAPEVSFAAHPSAWLGDSDRVKSAPDALPRLAGLLAMPLTNVAADRRCADPSVLAELLRAAATTQPIGSLTPILERSGAAPEATRATVAWLLKYGLLVVDPAPNE